MNTPEAHQSTDASVEGRCLCGNVIFSVVPPTDFVAHCHCRSCRLSHGAPFVTWTSVPLAQFAFLKGESEMTWYRSSDAIEWGFCRRCGSSMLYRADKQGHPEAPKTDRMYVSVGSLTGPLDQEAGAHVSFEEATYSPKQGHLLPKYRGKGVALMEES